MSFSVFEDDPFSFAPASGYAAYTEPNAGASAAGDRLSDAGSVADDDDIDGSSSHGSDTAGCDGDEHLLEHILATRLAAEFGPDSAFALPLPHAALSAVLGAIAKRHRIEADTVDHNDALALEAALEQRLTLDAAGAALNGASDRTIFAPISVAAASADLALLRALRANNYALGVAAEADEFQYRDWGAVVGPLEQYSKLETLPLVTALGVEDLNATPAAAGDPNGGGGVAFDAPHDDGMPDATSPCCPVAAEASGQLCGVREAEGDTTALGPPAEEENAAQWLMEQGEFLLKDSPTTRFMRSRCAVLFSVALTESREQLHARLSTGGGPLSCHLDPALGDAVARVAVGYVGRDPIGVAAFLPATARQFADAMVALPNARPSAIRRDDLLPFFKWNRKRGGAAAGGSPSGDMAAAGLTADTVARMLRRRTGIYLAPRALRTYVYQDANLLRSYLAGSGRPLGAVPFVCIDVEAARMRLDAIPAPLELAAYGGCVDGPRDTRVSYHTFVHPGYLPPGQTTDAQLSCGFVPGSHGIPARNAAFLRTDYRRVAAELRRLFVDGANDFVFVFKGNNAVDINAMRVVFAIGAAMQDERSDADERTEDDDMELYVPEIHAFDVATLARALQLDPDPVQRSLHRPLSYEASVAHARWYEGRAEVSRLAAQRAAIAAALETTTSTANEPGTKDDAEELRKTATALDEVTATLRAEVAADELTWRAEEDPMHAEHACWFHHLETTRARAPGLHCALLDSVLLFDVVAALVRAAPAL